MKKEDIEFLKELQHEMLTQDTVGQANPRFWVVQGTITQYGVSSSYNSDGAILCDENDEAIAEDMKEACDYLIDVKDDRYNFKYIESEDCINYIDKDDDNEECTLYDIEDVMNFLDDNKYSISYYRNITKNYENTMFLTLRKCKEHIEANYYHYPKDAHPYAMTAWRSPQVERLYKILQNTDWDNL